MKKPKRGAGKGSKEAGAKAPVKRKSNRKAARSPKAARASKSPRKAKAPLKATASGKTQAAAKSKAAQNSKTAAKSKAATKSKAAQQSKAKATPRKAPAPRRPLRAPRAGSSKVTAAARSVRRAGPRAARPVARRAKPTRPASKVAGVIIKGALKSRYNEILSRSALTFLAELHRRFDGRRKRLLGARAEQQKFYDGGSLPDFLPETKGVRDQQWKIATIPQDLLDRRVEITGPVDRKMIVNALNSGANVFMADFEDANSPTWTNNVEGQINLKDRWQGTIGFTDSSTKKRYDLGPQPAVLIVRPRGWHLAEEHMRVDNAPISASLFDFGLYFFHNAEAMIAQGTGPYFYLPKIETHLEAQLWNDVFVFAQTQLGIPIGTIKATVLIETLPAAFEMEEILWELRDHITGLNAGRWDYIFSFIKKFARNNKYVLPDRAQIVMGKAFLGAYAALLVKTCHRRGAFAMGGMAAQIPVKNNPAANEAAFGKVRADKEREVREGHDGTWVAHPDLVPVAKEVFDRLMPRPNQLDRWSEELQVTRDMLLQVPEGSKTENGFRHNIRVGIQYIEAWLSGRGAVPIYNLMEDAATAEISRAQIWQWLRYGVALDTGVKATAEFFTRALGEEMARVKKEIGAKAYDAGRFPEAIKLFSEISLANEFVPFLTEPAYKLIV